MNEVVAKRKIGGVEGGTTYSVRVSKHTCEFLRTKVDPQRVREVLDGLVREGEGRRKVVEKKSLEESW